MRAVKMQRQHAKVRRGVAGKLAVQAHFFFAEVLALFQRGEIKKAEVHGLFDFVDVVFRQIHARGVRFGVFNGAGLTGVVGAIKQEAVHVHGEKSSWRR